MIDREIFLARFQWFIDEWGRYDQQMEMNGGKLPRSDHWRRDYCKDPYLIRTSDDDFFCRWHLIVTNMWELTEQGKMSLGPLVHGDPRLIERWTHLLQESSARGGIDAERTAENQFTQYSAGGTPKGVELFRDFRVPEKPVLVKFSKREFLEDMIRYGRFLISPASSYERASLLAAQRDLETSRSFTVPLYKEWMERRQQVELGGRTFNPAKEDAIVGCDAGDYYLLSFCREIDRRLPTDFMADGALIISDRRKFTRLFFDEMRKKLSSWKQLHGNVEYYDPYYDYCRYKELTMIKHIGYHYQKEYRYVCKPVVRRADLEPFFIEIGPMSEFASLIVK